MDEDGIEHCYVAHAKLVRVAELVQAARRDTVEADIRAVILSDRPGSGEYQRWLDTAGAPLLAEYVLAQLPTWPRGGSSSGFRGTLRAWSPEHGRA
jgi:hypothetical protein